MDKTTGLNPMMMQNCNKETARAGMPVSKMQ